MRADLPLGQGHPLLAARDVPLLSPKRAQRGTALAPLRALADPPEQSGDTAGLQGGTQKIWEHIKEFPKAEPTITTLESSLVPAGILMVPRADLAARGSQVTFHPLFQATGLQPLLCSPHVPSSLPARLLQGAGTGS